MKQGRNVDWLHNIAQIVLACCMCVFSISAIAAASSSVADISHPRFFQISTKQGLSQDTVNDMIIDNNGYLWIATETGLNRFDGSKIRQINGLGNEFSDLPIYQLFQSSDNKIWLSAGNSGVFTFDPSTQKIELIVQESFANYGSWFQYAMNFTEPQTGNVLITLNETILQYDLATQTLSPLFTLSQTQIDRNVSINYAVLQQNILFVATSSGLFAIDQATNVVVPLPLDRDDIADLHSYNSKVLYVDPQQNILLVGLVQGLVRFDLDALIESVQQGTEAPQASIIDQQRNIHSIVYRPVSNQFYVGTDLGVFMYDPSAETITYQFAPLLGDDVAADLSVTDIVIDEKQNLWLSTQFNGALFWTPNSVKFSTIKNSRDNQSAQVLTNNLVWSFYQQNYEELWVGTDNGLTQYNLLNGTSALYLDSEEDIKQYGSTAFHRILPAPDNHLWLVNDNGLQLFNVASKQIVALPEVSNIQYNWSQQYINHAALDKTGWLWFIDQASIKKFNYHTSELRTVYLPQGLNYYNISSIIGVDPLDQNRMLIGGIGALFSVDINSGEFALYHQLEKLTSVDVYASEVLLDNNRTLWISYPGYGLVGLDSVTFAPLHKLNKDRLLASNLVYGLQESRDGYIWFSSHSGLHSLNPFTLKIENYHLIDGLDSVEFNQYAFITLQNGDFVYGSPKGFTRFNGVTIKQLSTPVGQVDITEVTLNNRVLNTNLHSLSGHDFELEHDDIGLTIYFAQPVTYRKNGVRFSYELRQRNQVITQATTSNNQVMFAKLEPGEYTFSVQIDGQAQTIPATISLNIRYPVWASPLAYALYFLIVAGVLVIWATHRQHHAQQLAETYKNLEKIKDRLSNAMAASNSHVWEYHRGDKTITAARFIDDLGYTRGKTISFDGFLGLIHRRDKEKFLHAWNAFLNTESTKLDVAYRLVSVEGKSYWYRDLGNYIKDDKDNSIVVTGTYNNISDSMQVQEKIRMFGDAFKNTHDWVLILARNGKFVGANPALYERFDLTESEDLTYQLMHKFQSDQQLQFKMFNVLDQLKPGEYHKEVTQLNIPDGPVVDIMLTVKAIENAYEMHVIDNYMIIMTDITEQKNAERELMRVANYDDLTGLINRNLLMDRLVHSIEQCHRQNRQLGVIFVDLDRFKPINDSLGHEAGDTVLRAIGRRLQDNFRANDSVARLGGDEFVVLVDSIEHIEHLYPILDNLMKLIEMPVEVEKQSVSVSCSLGVSVYPQDGQTAHELIRNADIAMYYAKGQAHSGYQFYTDEMNETAREHLIMQNKIKVGHEHKEFLNHYQAIFDIDLNAIVGFELLMRWKRGRKYISPERFIPIAEEIGMIVEMTRDAIFRGIKDIAQWYAHGFDGYLSVNLSACHFETHFDVQEIVTWLQYYNLPTSAIRFEITENVLVRDQQKALSYMQALSDAGFIIALDDFGTGFSSLRYLKDFPFDVIKIDKSFVDGIGKDKNDEVIVLTTIAMAKSLNMKCIAEGIETAEQVAFFKENDCRFLQGYYFCKPAPSLETFSFLRENLQKSKQNSTIEQ